MYTFSGTLKTPSVSPRGGGETRRRRSTTYPDGGKFKSVKPIMEEKSDYTSTCPKLPKIQVEGE